MNAGKVWEADYWEMRLEPEPSCTVDGSSQLFLRYTAESHYRNQSLDYMSGIKLVSILSEDGWANFAYIDQDLVWEDPFHGAGTGTGNLRARVYGTVYDFGHWWYFKDCEIKIYQDGALVHTATIGDLMTVLVGKQPSARPYIGIPPEFTADSDVPILIKRADGYSKSGSGSAVVGWRWVKSGVGESYDCSLISGTPPGCVNTAPTLGTVSGSDTWTMTISNGTSVNQTGDDLVYEGPSSYVLPIPDVPRRWRRIGSDFRTIAVRGALPAARMLEYSHCETTIFGGGTTHDDDDVYTDVVPYRSELLSVVGASHHDFEDALDDTVYCLSYTRGGRIERHFYGLINHDQYYRADSVQLLGADAAPAGAFNYYDAPGETVTRYWDYLCNVHWNHGSWWEDWAVDGADLPKDVYWLPGRQPWLYNAALPDDEKRMTRPNVVLDAIRAHGTAAGWWALAIGPSVRMLGCSRFDVRDVTPRTSYTYDSGDSALFTLEDCTAVFGASIVLTATGGATTVAYELDLATFGSASELWNFLADQYKFDWTVTNVSAIRHYLVGADDNQNLLTFVKNAWTDRARAEATKYAGSYAIDNGIGLVLDTGTDSKASGLSAATMADPERVHAFELASGATWAKLRVEVDLTVSGSCTLEYPAFRTVGTSDPDLVWESGQCAAMIFEDQAGIRWGSEVWTDSTGALLSVPTVTGAGYQSSVVDGICWANVVLQGQERSTGLTAALSSLYDSVEGQAVEDVAFETAAVILPDPTRTKVQLALMNLYRECPPLADMPRKERDGDWAETGDFCLDVWSWSPEPQRYVVAGDDALELYDGATLRTSVETGYVAGWTVSIDEEAVDNTETGCLLKWAADGEEYARKRPFRGCLVNLGLRETVSAGCVSYDVSESMRHVRAFVDDSDVWVGRGFNATRPIAWADDRKLGTTDWVSIRWSRKSEDQAIWLARESSGALTLLRSTNGGETFSPVSVLGAGTKPSLCVSESGRILVFWRDGSGNLKVQARNRLGSVTEATATAVAGVDDEGCCCYELRTAQGRKFALLYVSGGNLYRKESDDGKTWGLADLVEASGKKPTAYRDAFGGILEAWVSGAKIRGRRLDPTGAVVASPSDWVASGVDDEGIAVASSTGYLLEWGATLLYSSGGSLVQAFSKDALAWS